MKNKALSLLLSLVIAFAMWMYVVTTVSTDGEDTFYNIPVVFEGETAMTERGLMLTSGTSATVTLRIDGKRSDLKRINSGNITVKVNLATVYDPGEHQLSYTIGYPGDVPSGAFTVVSRSPAQIHISVEQKLRKDVPVEIIYAGTAPEGFLVDQENAALDYSFISVSGPSSVVEQIDCARIHVNLEGQSESISGDYRFTLCDAEGNPVDAEQVVTNVAEVHLDLKIERFEEIPLALNINYGGIRQERVKIEIKPAAIQIAGSEALLDGLTEIVLGNINLAEIPENTQMTFPVELPERVSNISGVDEAVVTIEFVGLASKEFTVENIQTINVPEGLDCKLMNEVLKVTLRAPTAVMNQLKLEDILVTVDLTGKEVGATTCKAVISVQAEGFSEVTAVGTYSVPVTLTETK